MSDLYDKDGIKYLKISNGQCNKLCTELNKFYSKKMTLGPG